MSFPSAVVPLLDTSSKYLATIYPCVPSDNTTLDQSYPSTFLYLPFSIIVTLCPTVNVVYVVVPDVPGPFLTFPGSIAIAVTLQFVTSSITLNPFEIIYPFFPLSSTTLSHTYPFSFSAPISILSTFASFFNVANFVELVFFELYTTTDESVI